MLVGEPPHGLAGLAMALLLGLAPGLPTQVDGGEEGQLVVVAVGPDAFVVRGHVFAGLELLHDEAGEGARRERCALETLDDDGAREAEGFVVPNPFVDLEVVGFARRGFARRLCVHALRRG